MSKISIEPPKDGWTAWGYVLFGALFLLKSPAGIPLYLGGLETVYTHVMHVIEPKSEFREAEPRTPPDSAFIRPTVFPIQDKNLKRMYPVPRGVWINGNYWGMPDPEFETVKIAGEPTIIVLHRPTRRVFELKDERLESIKKKE